MEILTLALVAITVLVSYLAFNNDTIMHHLLLYPAQMKQPSEYYRFITNGFVHADWQHLLFNMITLYFVGSYVETYFAFMGHRNFYLYLYVLGIIVASLPSFIKQRHNYQYRSLGASGGTSAVLFALVYINPWMRISFFFIPMWSILFAVLYIGYSVYMSRERRDNINHDAHLWGALFGFVFCWLSDPEHGAGFLIQLQHPPFAR